MVFEERSLALSAQFYPSIRFLFKVSSIRHFNRFYPISLTSLSLLTFLFALLFPSQTWMLSPFNIFVTYQLLASSVCQRMKYSERTDNRKLYLIRSVWSVRLWVSNFRKAFGSLLEWMDWEPQRFFKCSDTKNSEIFHVGPFQLYTEL